MFARTARVILNRKRKQMTQNFKNVGLSDIVGR